jgi:hypothetical protein
MYDTADIKDRVDLVALIEETTQLKKTGVNYLGMCPFHANSHSPALAVFPVTKTWHCFGSCGEGGDVFAWWMKRENVSFGDAVKALAERIGAKEQEGGNRQPRPPAPLPEGPSQAWCARAEEFVTYAEQCLWSDQGAKALEYLVSERGLWEETIRAFRLGYNPTNIYDAPEKWGMSDGKKVWLSRGMVIPGIVRGAMIQYVKIRRPRPKDSLAKYISPLTKNECITDEGRLNPNDDVKFGGPRGGRQAILFTCPGQKPTNLPVLILSEGEWDAMLAWQWGHDLCDVGTFGGAAARADAMRMAVLTRYVAIAPVMDGDGPGQENVKKYWAKLAEETGRVHVIPPPDHDLTDYHRRTDNLRLWMAGVVADLLDGVLAEAEGAPESWVRVRDWARMESVGAVEG